MNAHRGTEMYSVVCYPIAEAHFQACQILYCEVAKCRKCHAHVWASRRLDWKSCESLRDVSARRASQVGRRLRLKSPGFAQIYVDKVFDWPFIF